MNFYLDGFISVADYNLHVTADMVLHRHYRTEVGQNSQGGLNTVYHPENAWVYFF